MDRDKARGLNGISEYAKDNKMDALLKDERSIETAEFLTYAFLEPFLKMPVNMVQAYFENYAIIKEFKMLSNTVFDLARKKSMTSNVVLLPKDIEERTICCISKIYSIGELEKSFAAEISDVIMETDYVKGKTDKLSIRLARMVE